MATHNLIWSSFGSCCFRSGLNEKPTILISCVRQNPSISLSPGRTLRLRFSSNPNLITRRNTSPAPATMLLHNPVLSDISATAFSGGIALLTLRLWEETAKRGLFDQKFYLPLFVIAFACGFVNWSCRIAKKMINGGLLPTSRKIGKLNRKLVHISIGLVFMLCWPLFSSGYEGAMFASLIPGVNIIKMLLLGSGIWKDEATVKSMTRLGDYRELLKGPLYYALMITLASLFYWRTPVSIAVICNLCAGDGFADIVGRRYGATKLPYNRNKSLAGSLAMASAGFVASIGYMCYFASFGYVEESWGMILGFLLVSMASAMVESLPISTDLDDNLTVPLTSFLLGTLIL